MATTFINAENMLTELKVRMNHEMMAAAEPVIKKAVEDAEREIRRRLGVMIISLIDQSFSIEKRQNELLIRVEHRKE